VVLTKGGNMGALHFLDIGPLPDAKQPNTTHGLEVFEMGGGLYLRATIAPPTGNDQAYCANGLPYTASITATMQLTSEQMHQLEQALESARTRLAY
jgi:hypothetical protein